MRRWWWVALVGWLTVGFGMGDLEKGNRLYRAGRYAEAAEAYRSALASGSDSPQLHYNLGTALLQLGNFAEAQQHLQVAVAAVDPEVRPRALYNLGTTYLQAGRAAQETEQRGSLLDGAVEAFKQALRLNPADLDAKWNLEMALREREQPPPSAGGGGDDQNDQDQADDAPAGGGAGDQQRPGQNQDEPSGAEPMPLTPEEAERILNAVAQDERDVYRQQLQRDRRDVRIERDW